MSIYQNSRRCLPFAVLGIALLLSLCGAKATDLNPAAIKTQLPDQIKWEDDLKRGESTAVLAGDPEKEGMYVELVKWHAHHMSHPLLISEQDVEAPVQFGVPGNLVETVAQDLSGNGELLRSAHAHVHFGGEELEAQVGVSYFVRDAEECAAYFRNSGYAPT